MWPGGRSGAARTLAKPPPLHACLATFPLFDFHFFFLILAVSAMMPAVLRQFQGSFRGVCRRGSSSLVRLCTLQQQVGRTDLEFATLCTPMRTMLAYFRMTVLWGSLWVLSDDCTLGPTGGGSSRCTTVFIILSPKLLLKIVGGFIRSTAVWRKFQGSFGAVSGEFQGSFREVPGKFPGSFREVSGEFQEGEQQLGQPAYFAAGGMGGR